MYKVYEAVKGADEGVRLHTRVDISSYVNFFRCRWVRPRPYSPVGMHKGSGPRTVGNLAQSDADLGCRQRLSSVASRSSTGAGPGCSVPPGARYVLTPPYSTARRAAGSTSRPGRVRDGELHDIMGVSWRAGAACSAWLTRLTI